MDSRYFDDIEVDETAEFDAVTLSKEDIFEYAEKFDPLPFHVDEEAAAETIYGGLIASGWHTAAVGMRFAVDSFIQDLAGMGGRGVDDLRWLNPVRPGDTLSGRGVVVDKRQSSTHSDRGYVDFEVTLTNQAGDEVLRMTLLLMVKRKS